MKLNVNTDFYQALLKICVIRKFFKVQKQSLVSLLLCYFSLSSDDSSKKFERHDVRKLPGPLLLSKN